MAESVGDCNGDGLQDIFVTRLGYGSLYVGTPKRLFEDAMMPSRLGLLTSRFVGWGGNFFDMDNDGDLDLFVANGDALFLLGSESLLLQNDGTGVFSDANETGGAFFKCKVRARASAVCDFNNDGYQDLVVTAIGDRPFLLRNRSTSGNHWISLDLQGTRSNRDGFGALIKVAAGNRSYAAEARCAFGFLMQSDRRVHFGIGKAEQVDNIEIRWPSGTLQRLANIKSDRILKITESDQKSVARN